MPNKNYQAGRRLEYACIAYWKARGYHAVRTAGSHGLFDVVAFREDRKPEFIQCKRVRSAATAKRLLDKFRDETLPSPHYHQVMEVKIKGTSGVISTTV